MHLSEYQAYRGLLQIATSCAKGVTQVVIRLWDTLRTAWPTMNECKKAALAELEKMREAAVVLEGELFLEADVLLVNTSTVKTAAKLVAYLRNLVACNDLIGMEYLLEKRDSMYLWYEERSKFKFVDFDKFGFSFEARFVRLLDRDELGIRLIRYMDDPKAPCVTLRDELIRSCSAKAFPRKELDRFYERHTYHVNNPRYGYHLWEPITKEQLERIWKKIEELNAYREKLTRMPINHNIFVKGLPKVFDLISKFLFIFRKSEPTRVRLVYDMVEAGKIKLPKEAMEEFQTKMESHIRAELGSVAYELRGLTAMIEASESAKRV